MAIGHRGENETSFDDGERSNHFCGYQNLHQQQVTTNPASKIAERETKAVMLGANPGRTLLINFDMKYIDADKIRTEIKRLKAENNCGTDEFIAAKDIAYDKVFDFLDTLEEPVSDDLEEAAEKHASGFPFDNEWQSIANNAFIAGAGWMAKQQPLPEDSVAFQKGVQEGRRLEREDVKSTIQSRIDEILGDAQPNPILRMELQELIKKIEA